MQHNSKPNHSKTDEEDNKILFLQRNIDQDQQKYDQICSRSQSPTQQDQQQSLQDLKIQQQNLEEFKLSVAFRRLQRDTCASAEINAEEVIKKQEKQELFNKLILKLNENIRTSQDIFTDLDKQYQSLVQNNFKQNELSKQEQITSLELSVSRNSKYSDSQSETRWSNYDIEKVLNYLRNVELHQTLEFYTPQDKNLKELYELFMINDQQTRTDAAIKAKLGEIINNITKTKLWTFDQIFKLKEWALTIAKTHIVTRKIANTLQIDKTATQIVEMLWSLKIKFVYNGIQATFRRQ
ncbi:Hypothetical_protein [Hexamita inflata]|uniref:Hypothetical_protein n=1 Tax=Hexamita inflata TaxID=28002 RepID=A0AA86P7J1_9EUKA|nr:Hypothetical protein HINF_LOCUS19569 [Hexamita inflata]